MSYGVDLLEIEGIGLNFILTLLGEIGMDLSMFPTSKHFVSWLCLCPNKKVSGGKVLSSKTRKNTHRLRQAFRQAALGVAKRKGTPLASFYHRMAYKNGKGTAITATARKLAVIVYNMVKHGQSYRPESLEQYQERVRELRIKKIQKTVKKLEVKEGEISF